MEGALAIKYIFQKLFKSVRNGIVMFSTFIVTMLVLLFVGKAIWGVDESNVLKAPDWYAVFMLFACVGAAIAVPKLLTRFVRVPRIGAPSGPMPELPIIAEAPKETELSLSEAAGDEAPAATAKPTGIDAVDLMDGHEFEYWCAAILRRNGFQDVEVTKASGDQGVDVLATKDGVSYAIQCKCYSHDLGNTPVQEVNTGKMFYRRHIGVVMTNRYFTQGAKDAAAATGVLLWDRDKLQEFIHKAAKVNRYMYEDF